MAARIGWAVLGCGDITEKRGAPALVDLPEALLVGFHSRSAERGREFAGRFGALRSTTSRDEILADPMVQAVYVATEHFRHLDDVLACAAAGKHVLCEKPIANTAEDGARMVDACRANGVSLQVAYYRRYYPKLLKMKQLLDAGAIGEPVSASIHLSSRLHPARLGPEEQHQRWHLSAELSGGGALVDTGSHRLDILCWLLGKPDRVAALVECREWPIEAPDMEALLIRMERGVHVATRHGYRSGSPDELSVAGTEGTLDATGVDGPDLRLHTGSGASARTETFHMPKHPNMHYPLFEDFNRAIMEGRPPTHTGEDGLQASRIISAAYESARTGRIVAV